jgi:hypothetical protein
VGQRPSETGQARRSQRWLARSEDDSDTLILSIDCTIRLRLTPTRLAAMVAVALPTALLLYSTIVG